jgi:membrane associated rhomboid family serine protease
MIPIGDDDTARKTIPIVTYTLILLNVCVFLLELVGGEEFIMKWAFIPSRFIAHPMSNISTIFSSMFMHAGWGHLIGNMLYLWIFGDNIEDRFGKVKFLIFYLVSGIAATFAQMMFSFTSNIPNVGASGAIAGVLGAYIFYFPQGKVNVMFGQHITQLPALVVIGFWFLMQFFSGLASTASTADTGGVAYMAHIGGFMTGFIIAIVFQAFESKKP